MAEAVHLSASVILNAFRCSFPLPLSPSCISFAIQLFLNILLFGGCLGQPAGRISSKSLHFVNDSISVRHLSSVCHSRLGGPGFGDLIMDLFWITEKGQGPRWERGCWNSLSTFFKYESQTQVLRVLTHLYPTLLPPPSPYSGAPLGTLQIISGCLEPNLLYKETNGTNSPQGTN